jgi:anti-sigma regulatory factor (Ser/Thr protein kinase)
MGLVRRFSITVEPRAESVTALRHLVTSFLEANGDLDRVDRFAMELLTSETAANAVRHGTGEVTLTAVSHPTTVRIEMSDLGEAMPVVLESRPDQPYRGRGMMLVSQLSDRWGIETRVPGKVVWFEMDCALADR